MINKRKSRQIEVDGEVYRWLVSKRRKWWVGDLSIAIEKIDNGHTALVVNPGFSRPNKSTSPEQTTDIVTPNNVQEYILFAKENGWEPEKKGSALLLIWEKRFLTNDISQNNWRAKQ